MRSAELSEEDELITSDEAIRASLELIECSITNAIERRASENLSVRFNSYMLDPLA